MTDRDGIAGPRAGSDDIVPLREAGRVWTLVALQSFGGPAGQIAVMQRTLVDERRWIGRERFTHALSYCTLLPGPEAFQLAVYIGWLLNGVRGGVLAGGLFVLPGAVAMGALSAVYVAFGTTRAVTAVFVGIGPAVLAIVVQALHRLARRSLRTTALVAVALGAFVALAAFAVPFPVVVLSAGAAGWLLGRRRPLAMAAPADDVDDGPAALLADTDLHQRAPTLRRTAAVLGTTLLTWGLPVVAVMALTGRHSTLSTQGLFFSGTAVVTFGGAYAVLSFVAQRAVDTYGWLSAREMVRGLGLAETTPGPLVMVLQFVGFLGAYRSPGELDPWLAGIIGAALTTWVTFVPAAALVLLGAPYVERLRHNRSLSAALAGVSAAVVGVIASLALFFALHTLFARVERHTYGPLHLDLPLLSTVQPVACTIAVAAAVLIFLVRWSVLRTIGVCALLGLAAAAIGLQVGS